MNLHFCIAAVVQNHLHIHHLQPEENTRVSGRFTILCCKELFEDNYSLLIRNNLTWHSAPQGNGPVPALGEVAVHGARELEGVLEQL